MESEERARFTAAFAEMDRMLNDERGAPKEPGYWALLQENVSLEEWEYATQQAQRRETFRGLPLPAHLLDYVREYRSLQAQVRREDERRARQGADLVAEAEALLHTAHDGRSTKRIQREIAEKQEQQAYEDWLMLQPKRVLVALAKGHPRHPQWQGHSAFHYEQTTTPDAERARLRGQLLRLMNDDTQRGR